MPEEKEWSWGQFWGWGVGGALGAGGAGAGIDAIPSAGVAAPVSGAIGAAGGFVAGAGGYTLSYWWDLPMIKWDFRSAALFSTTFSLLIASVLGFSSLDFIYANPSMHNITIFVISLIAGFASATLGGVLNNLRRNSVEEVKKKR